jgi:hypothetical protein
MLTYRYDQRREQLRRRELRRYEALVEARRRLGERLYALSGGEPFRSAALEAPEPLAHHLALGRQLARVSDGALLTAGAAVLGLVVGG